MNYCVYKHTSPNGKVYIGITCRNPAVRWNGGKGYEKNPHFYRAICEYGWDSFRHEILFAGLSKSEACEKEVELISEYNSNDANFGYNLSSGGECGAKGVKYSEERKTAISERFKKIERTAEWRANISDALKGNTNCKGKAKSAEHVKKVVSANKGKKRTEEQRRRISEGHKGQIPSNTKKVTCVETGVQYDSIKEASLATGIAKESICRACKGSLGKAGAFHWKYMQ
jgi:group I intron endonuclease